MASPDPPGRPSQTNQPNQTNQERPAAAGRRFGAEWDHHVRTFMCWPASDGIWEDLLPDVRAEIAELAAAIAATEPVVLLARPNQVKDAQRACGRDVQVIDLPVDDLWARDTVPVFVSQDSVTHGVDLNFNGWGDKQPHDNDALVARRLLDRYAIARDETWIVAEGGSLETDGAGTLLVTESSVVNDNRNPGSRSRTS